MSETLPYWLVNVPEDQRPATCPEFLRDIPEKLKLILSTPDSQYRRFTWPQVKEIVRENHIDAFQRLPSDMRRYLGHMVLLKKSHGSVMNFVLTERLGWKDLTPAGPPFSNSGKYNKTSSWLALLTDGREGYQDPLQRLVGVSEPKLLQLD